MRPPSRLAHHGAASKANRKGRNANRNRNDNGNRSIRYSRPNFARRPTWFRLSATANRKIRADAREFERIFHVPLSEYWQGFLGFDITGFDDKVIKSGTMSVKAAVLQTYGQDAVTLIQDLLGMQR